MAHRTDPARIEAMTNAEPGQQVIRCLTRRGVRAGIAREDELERRLLVLQNRDKYRPHK